MDKLTVVELRKVAKEKKVKGYSSMKKADLIKALGSRRSSDQSSTKSKTKKLRIPPSKKLEYRRSSDQSSTKSKTKKLRIPPSKKLKDDGCKTVYLLIQYVEPESAKEGRDVFHLIRGVFKSQTDAVTARKKAIRFYQKMMRDEMDIDTTVDIETSNDDVFIVTNEAWFYTEMMFEIQKINIGELLGIEQY